MPVEIIEKKKKRGGAPRPLVLQDYRLLFANLREICELAFNMTDAKASAQDKLELARTLERLARGKLAAFEAKRRLVEGGENEL